ncbi:uncharacterized protein LOC124326575 [Daphnia pulicaria]|nr:uncharacterized protein LOC124326575 [Daphnia pulicaria]
MHPCENFKFCGRTFEKRLKMHNHYKNCMIERVCPICRTRPRFKSESGFRNHALMHKRNVQPLIFGIGRPTSTEPINGMEVVPKEIPIPKSSNVQETTTENDDDVEVIPEEIPIPESSKVQETTKKESDNDGHFSRDEVLVRIEKLNSTYNNFMEHSAVIAKNLRLKEERQEKRLTQ